MQTNAATHFCHSTGSDKNTLRGTITKKHSRNEAVYIFAVDVNVVYIILIGKKRRNALLSHIHCDFVFSFLSLL